MTEKSIVNILTYLEPVLCAMVVLFLLRSKDSRKFGFLTALLIILRSSHRLSASPLLYFAENGIERYLAYDTYFYVYWSSYVADAILSLMLVYSIFKLSHGTACEGLQTLEC